MKRRAGLVYFRLLNVIIWSVVVGESLTRHLYGVAAFAVGVVLFCAFLLSVTR